MKGRKPTPTRLKIVRGNPGKRPLNKNEPKPTQKLPACPAFLDRAAKREWKRLAPDLTEIGLLTAADMAIFAGYCAAYSTFTQAQTKLREHGRMVRAANGEPKPSPWLRIANQAQDQIFKVSGELGLTPSARVRLTGSAGGATTSSPKTPGGWDDL